MSDINDLYNAFRECIDAKYIPPTHSGGLIKLEERKKNATCREVILNTKKISTKPFLIKLEASEEREKSGKKTMADVDIHPLLNELTGLKTGCDYLLICPTDEKIYILVIELKSKGSNEWIDQCIAGECLTTYLITTVNRFKKLKLKHELIFRYVLFRVTPNGRKRLTGTRTETYQYDKERDIHFAIWSCFDDGEGHDLRLFLREK